MLIGAARLAVAEMLLETAVCRGWRYAGWVATWRHDALARDVLACEPVTLQLHDRGQDLDAAASDLTRALAGQGWRVAATRRTPMVRVLAAAVPDRGHSVLLRLDQRDPPAPTICYLGDWPCLDAAGQLAATAGLLALLPTAARHLRSSWAIDLLQLIRLVDDATLDRLFQALPAPAARRITTAVHDVPDWMTSPSPRSARDLADGRRLLGHLLPVLQP